MPISLRSKPSGAIGALIILLVIALIGIFSTPGIPPVQAEGSGDVSAGWRPFIEWHATETSGGVPRRSTMKAFVRAGEAIFLGSSAIGVGQGDIVIRPPTGAFPTNADSCVERNGGPVGRIANLAEEQNGPQTAANPGGFVPCVISTTETSAAGDGIWEFDFISPNPTAPIANNPVPLRFDQEWAGRPADQTGHWIVAWDVSVRDAGGDNELPGRVFASYIASNLGANANTTSRSDLGLNTNFFILTFDGFGYRVNTNGIDPFGFIFFSNSEGITDSRGNPIYRSLQLRGQAPNISLPDGYALHGPQLEDNPATNDITHKIFFDRPDPTMPLDAVAPGGKTTWLLREPVELEQAQNFSFTGIEGTPGQAGTSPLSGIFSFSAAPNTGFQILLDTNRSGVFGDNTADGRDRILSGTTTNGITLAPWDGLDADGNRVTAGSVAVGAQLQLFGGEVHFPFIDAENNPNGLILERIRDPQVGDEPNRFNIYWNDRYIYNTSSSYEFSPCAFGDTPPPPAGEIGGGSTALSCYGTPLDGRDADGGVSSQAGAHRWTYEVGPSTGFGDRRVIDTWAYYPSNIGPVTTSVTLAEAELSITKSSSPNPLRPGDTIRYEVVVTNGGPSDVAGATVTDNVPPQVQNTTWTCTVSGGGSCAQANGSGNIISTTVDLNSGASATFSIVGTLSQSASGTLENVAVVRRTNDTTDINPSNNIARNQTPIIPVSDLELTKVISTPPAQISAGGEISFTIALRNRGPSDATGVAVSDRLPAGLSFVRAQASRGSYDPASGIWSVGDLANGEVTTLLVVATWDGSNVRNTAQVSASDQEDPDSTPNNNTPGEDDQSSVDLPLMIADLELTKRVNTARVNVGSNAIFTIELTNRGPVAASGVRVGDRMPLELSVVRATPQRGSYDLASGTWNVGNIAVGETLSLELEVTLLGTGPFTNIAQVTASDQFDPDSIPNNDSPLEDDQGFATIGGDLSDLSLSKAIDNPQPAVNGQVVYTIRLRNSGPSAATGVAVLDRLPAGLAYVGSTTSQGSYDPASGIWTVGSVANGGQATLTITATVLGAAPIRNSAQISTSDQPDPDSTPGNNTPGEDDQSSVSLTPQVADLSLLKSVTPSNPPANSQVTFTIALTNSGPIRASGVQVSEKLPAGLTYLSHSLTRGSYNPVNGLWDVGNIALNETLELQIRAQLTGVGPYVNTAQVSKSDQFDPDSTPNNSDPAEDDQSSVSIGAELADLSVSKGVDQAVLPADGIVTFTIGVFNSGPSPATNVALSENLPNNAELLATTPSQGTYDNATNSWSVGRLEVGGSATLLVQVRLSGAGPFINTAQVSASDQADPDSTPGNNDPREDDQASAAVGIGNAPELADLRLLKTARAIPRLPDGVAYVITLTNDGPSQASGVEVSDRLPAGLRFVDAAPSQGRYNPDTGIWTVGTLPVNASATLVITALFTTDAAVTNTAQVSKSDQFDPDSTPNNNDSSEDDQSSVTVSRTTAISLLSFKAIRSSEGLRITWQTGTELNSAGFHVYRGSSDQRSQALRITPQLIAARGSAGSGAQYSFLDRTAALGGDYYYWLVEIERSGATNQYGPVRPGNSLNTDTRIYLPLLFR